MRIMQIAHTVLIAGLFGSIISAQAPAPAAGAGMTGVKVNTIISRPEIRVLRLDLQPGAVRAVHSHNDPNVFYNLFLPITAGIELTMGTDAPKIVNAGDAFYLAKGTPHGFKNTAATPGMVYEVFIQDPNIPNTPHGPNAQKAPAGN